MFSHILGFPRIGRNRELKQAVERFQRGKSDPAALRQVADDLKQQHWQDQIHAGLSLITTGDFALYDHVLDTLCLLGLVPKRFDHHKGPVPPATYFRMARGDRARNIPAMEMTKWFDTNYHYIVPELGEPPRLDLHLEPMLADINAVKALGHTPKPVLLGPVSLVHLAKKLSPQQRQNRLDALTEAYLAILKALGDLVPWLQLDEPVLALDLDEATRETARAVWRRLNQAGTGPNLLLAGYFAPYADNRKTLLQADFAGIHLDLVRGRDDLDPMLAALPRETTLSLGLVNGRNIWKTDLNDAFQVVDNVVARVGEQRVMVASSCSLLHAPIDLTAETELDKDLVAGMAFAVQKCAEVALLAHPASPERDRMVAKNQEDLTRRRKAGQVVNPEIRRRLEQVTETDLTRHSPFPKRKRAQAAGLNLPLLPTTTIGSFPQTKKIRAKRRAFKAGKCSAGEYRAFLEEEIRATIQRQEELGLDVLVHGESERNDMVEYFGEQLDGFCFTQNGWVQSYGNRCVKPPIIFGDVARPNPMTVGWMNFARSCTNKPIKAMLTGPVTLLCWSFVREDLPRETVCRQLALAVRDEVADLERAGFPMIQIDEAALREGMPLRRVDQNIYLAWAVDAFRLASAGVADQTQIHTHMCYSAFNEIIEWIAKLDADVISIECSRGGMKLLNAFADFAYPNDVGPGVYDIHSPRVPDLAEIVRLLQAALQHIPAEQLWVNPDCGLKTRNWDECTPALEQMVQAARQVRLHLSAHPVA
ncbi:5-methyltetrahydropteroyltriglutamate--homocysteine S-methyltransferase [Acanthopleuribacter pedis]|uniref:5-methyltetrahydropteroyltriglutamate--homocysteine methyltransferase n=1 Tax=Acanthopleuribacter pedis TaxID=442870 RepID=A0A8J7QCG4_9BACT|nr:5-methyltetrahydropteroyltriglutamate--homocysteine S-methyltransferase [Acanthopleuribacter pedis]MBO1321927.1 5-methyltetrahydropteroyltriglutamate--homocysteine S-methyltransferase [Acanthopleuribacter pedis]